MKFNISRIVFLLGMFFSPMLLAQNDDLPKGRPFQVLNNNDIAILELVEELVSEIDGLYEEIDSLNDEIDLLSERVAKLEGGSPKDDDAIAKAKCLKTRGEWIDGECIYDDKDEKDEDAKAKLLCEKEGGTWVEGTCVIKPKEEEKKKKSEKSTTTK